jgi:hypothetical protein
VLRAQTSAVMREGLEMSLTCGLTVELSGAHTDD